MPYRIGDRVRVKSLEALTAISENAKDMVPVVDGFRIDGLLFNSRMIPYCGHVYTICKYSGDYFNLVDDAGDILRSRDFKITWSFSEKMLEPAEDVPTMAIELALSFEELFAKGALQ